MQQSKRFASPSASLSLGVLLRRGHQVLWTGLILALGVHLAFSRINVLRQEVKAAKPLTTQFVKRQPRLTKPLEMKKRPRPRKRQLQRRMVAVQARRERTGAASAVEPVRLIDSLARPGIQLRRAAAVQQRDLEPSAVATHIESAREPKEQMDLALELLDIEALDVGKYHALVVQDPQDRRSIKGFCHLAIVPPVSLERAATWEEGYSFEEYIVPGFGRLVAAMNQYTGVKTHVLGRIRLDDAEIFKAPWLLFEQREHFKLGEAALRNLGGYLLSGGFVFADGGDLPVWEAGLTAMLNALVGALKAHGVEGAVERLPNGHPIFHCFFDFDGPPTGGDSAGHSQQPSAWKVNRYLQGVEASGRLVALYSRKEYAFAWGYFGRGQYERWDPTRPLQFGVNTIVFALTQEGSITNRVLESLSY